MPVKKKVPTKKRAKLKKKPNWIKPKSKRMTKTERESFFVEGEMAARKLKKTVKKRKAAKKKK